MKKQKVPFYVFKWLGLIYLAYLILRDNQSRVAVYILIGFVSVLLVWEGIRDFKTKNN